MGPCKRREFVWKIVVPLLALTVSDCRFSRLKLLSLYFVSVSDFQNSVSLVLSEGILRSSPSTFISTKNPVQMSAYSFYNFFEESFDISENEHALCPCCPLTHSITLLLWIECLCPPTTSQQKKKKKKKKKPF